MQDSVRENRFPTFTRCLKNVVGQAIIQSVYKKYWALLCVTKTVETNFYKFWFTNNILFQSSILKFLNRQTFVQPARVRLTFFGAYPSDVQCNSSLVIEVSSRLFKTIAARWFLHCRLETKTYRSIKAWQDVVYDLLSLSTAYHLCFLHICKYYCGRQNICLPKPLLILHDVALHV